jgi:hypothetical protein
MEPLIQTETTFPRLGGGHRRRDDDACPEIHVGADTRPHGYLSAPQARDVVPRGAQCLHASLSEAKPAVRGKRGLAWFTPNVLTVRRIVAMPFFWSRRVGEGRRGGSGRVVAEAV